MASHSPNGDPSSASRSERAEALHRYDILDTPPEEPFDRIVDLAAHLFDVSRALLTFADDDRAWIKASRGFDRPEATLEAPFVRRAVREGTVQVVENLTRDPRLADHPLVTRAPGVRFYTGVPLVSPDDHVLGALCVLGTDPQSPTDVQIRQLETLAAMAVDELELRREMAERKRAQHRERLQSHILEQVAQGAPLQEILTDLVTAVEAECAPCVAAIQLYDAAEECLRHGAAPSLPNPFTEALDGQPVGPQAGSCGAAVHHGRTVVAEDIETDPRWDALRDCALRHDLRTGWSTPIFGSDDEILGTFALYDSRPARPPAALQPLIDEAQALARIAIERHRDVEALKASERRRREFMDRSPVGIYRTTPSGEIRYANDAFAQMLGVDGAEALDRYTLQDGVLGTYDRQAFKAALEEEGNVIQRESTFQRVDGDEVHVLESAHLAEENGEPVYVGIVEDITDRKEAEVALRKSRERWQHLVENQQDAIHISIDGVIQYVNPAGVNLVGAEAAEDVVGRSLHTFLTSEAAKAALSERLEQVRRGHTVPPKEHEIERLDGERRIVESYAVPVEYKGERAAQGIIRDLTERKRTQKQLRRAQKMETVGTLAGGIAHDFTNIIHAVKAYVQLVQDDLSDEDASQALLGQAARGLNRAEGLVDKLLTFSRRETTHEPVHVGLGNIVRESIDLVRPSLSNDVTVRTDLNTACTILGDPGELHQVATNIMTNAAQAMAGQDDDPPNVLDVDIRLVDVDADLARRHLNLEPGQYVRLSISDTGPGMDAATQERIFEPFFTTKDVGEGTGLGLSVVHGIVQSHDGEIVVYSEPGEGTTFNLYFPHAPAQSDRTAAPRPTPAEDEPEARILFVDDDEAITELESVRLRRLGYRVVTCAGAQAALRAFDRAAEPFDVVMTDYAMPSMNGLAFTRELRQRDYEGPVLLMSGFSAQVSPEAMTQAGVTAFLRKPVGSDELRQTLKQLP